MLTSAYRFLIIGFLLSLSTSMNAHVNVLYPVGGETFTQGYTIVIEWEIAQPHDLIDWDVYYSIDSGANWIPLGIDMPAYILTYEWVIPNVETDLGKIKVYMNNTGDDYIDYSGLFTIQPNTSPPTVDVEAQNITIPCNVATQQAAIPNWLNNHGDASIINFCGSLIWSHDYSLSNDCGASGDAFVTFTATDLCGSTETAALLTVQDAIPPAFTVPATSMTVESDGSGNISQLSDWLNSNAGATATDACGTISWTNDFTAFTNTCGHAGSTTVAFTAIDPCGNASTSTATFTITDQTPPTLLQNANNITIQLNPGSEAQFQNWLTAHGGASASNPGGTITWQHNYSALSDGCGATGNATVIFSASDECGNSISTTATVEVTDQSPPVFHTNASERIVYCGDSIQVELQQWLDAHGGASASDVGGDVTWQHNYTALADSCGITGKAVVTFTATDPCGNSAVSINTFTVSDLTPPVIETNALDTIIYCHQDDVSGLMQQWLSRQGGAHATDQCGAVTWTHNFAAVLDTCQLLATYPVTFTAWDECLNSVSTHATFTIIDSTITSFLDPSDVEFRLFPNPVDEVLTVEWENDGSAPVRLMLMDALGRNIWSGQTTSNKMIIPVNTYIPGIYFITFQREGSLGMKRVMVE